MPVRNEEHEELCDKIIHAFGSLPNIRMWKRIVGYDHSKNIYYGVIGESDLEGIIAPFGRMLCIECKTGKAVLSKVQKKRKLKIEKFGGIWITARSVNFNFDSAIKNALDEFHRKNIPLKTEG